MPLAQAPSLPSYIIVHSSLLAPCARPVTGIVRFRRRVAADNILKRGPGTMTLDSEAFARQMLVELQALPPERVRLLRKAASAAVAAEDTQREQARRRRREMDSAGSAGNTLSTLRRVVRAAYSLQKKMLRR